MKFGFLVLILMFYLVVNAQSKKEQIQILSTRLDSLKTVQSFEKQNLETRKNKVEYSISNTDHKTTEILKMLSTNKENVQN
jgi:outer membrane lipoprotein-sorting protein